jgi:hypothetical protein
MQDMMHAPEEPESIIDIVVYRTSRRLAGFGQTKYVRKASCLTNICGEFVAFVCALEHST